MAAHKRISIEVGIHIDISRGLRKSISIQMRLLQCTTLLYKTKPVHKTDSPNEAILRLVESFVDI